MSKHAAELGEKVATGATWLRDLWNKFAEAYPKLSSLGVGFVAGVIVGALVF